MIKGTYFVILTEDFVRDEGEQTFIFGISGL